MRPFFGFVQDTLHLTGSPCKRRPDSCSLGVTHPAFHLTSDFHGHQKSPNGSPPTEDRGTPSRRSEQLDFRFRARLETLCRLGGVWWRPPLFLCGCALPQRIEHARCGVIYHSRIAALRFDLPLAHHCPPLPTLSCETRLDYGQEPPAQLLDDRPGRAGLLSDVQ